MFCVSFIIPCYNSEPFIFSNIKKIINEAKRLKVNYQIIIINDGSTDNTNFEINKLKKNYKKIKHINSKENAGKSFSIRKGLVQTQFNNVILLDADLAYFTYIPKIISELKKNIDLVIVDRYHPRSVLKNNNLSIYQFCRKNIGKLISKIISHIVSINLGTIDTQAGLKGFKKINKFNRNKFISKKFFFDVELIYFFKRMNKKISLIPVEYKIEENSSIRLFSVTNFKIILDLVNVITYLRNLDKR